MVFPGSATGLWLGRWTLSEKELGLRNAGRLVDPGNHPPAQDALPLPEQMGVLPGDPNPPG
jgi:hypothetical protein